MTDPHEQRLLLVVIDGLGARTLRRALDEGHAPTIQSLIDAGARFDEAISPFPSLTPTCLATIATGVGPDRHRIPSLSWYHRGERRFVEYGSSFAAASVEGHARTIEDVMLNLNHVHLAEDPRTIFELCADGGKEAAAINYLVYRGRTRHTMKYDYGPLAQIGKRARVHAMYGPQHFYMGELFGSSRPLLPQVGIKRPLDWGAGHIARWLLRNTEAAFVLLYLGQHDVASHKMGPDDTQRAIRIADKAMSRVIAGVGGLEEFVRQFALVLCADHAQTPVLPGQYDRLGEVFDDVELFTGSRSSDAELCDLAISPSNRYAMIYRLHYRSPSSRWVSTRVQEAPGVDLAAFAEDGKLVVQRGEGELRIVRDESGTPTERAARELAQGDAAGAHDCWRIEGDLEVLDLQLDDGMVQFGDYPDALHRLDNAIRCVNSGDVLISGLNGWEFADIGGGYHAGGSHGSLHIDDSVAPLVTLGLNGRAPHEGDVTLRLEDIAPFIASHLHVDALHA